MKEGISSSTSLHEGRMDGYPYSMESAISALAQAGFTHVDLTFCHWCSPGGWMDSRDYLRFADGLGETAARCGVRFNQAHAHFYAHMGTPEENERSKRMVERCLEAAGRLQIPWIVMHILRVKDIGTADKRIGMKKNADYFRPYGELARRYGTGIAIENGLTGFFHSAEELLELLNRLDNPAFGLCWDTGHANITGQDQPKAILRMGSHLKAVHLNDNDGLSDQHLAPGLGTVNFEAIMRSLRCSGFQGVPTLECGGLTARLVDEARPAALRLAACIARSL